MGRGDELSEFQRGQVVGCHLCKKSTREISALLNLPRSTVGTVILKWKRGGITTALPRPGRPQKLGEEQRQLLERVALDRCLPTVAAVTAEFQSTSGAKVSSRTVRKELKEMGFTGRVTKYKKTKRAALNRTTGEADNKEFDPEQQVWDQIQTDQRTDHQHVGTYRGSAPEVAGKGVCQVQTEGDTQIKQTLSELFKIAKVVETLPRENKDK